MSHTADEQQYLIFEAPVSLQEHLDYYLGEDCITYEEWVKFTVPKSEQQIFYVYVYMNPSVQYGRKHIKFMFSHEPFYIGCGHGNRSQSHLNHVLKGKVDKYNPLKSNKIAKIIRNTGSNPTIQIIASGLTWKQSQELEILLIESIGRRDLNDGPLTNRTSGGEGGTGRIVTTEQREYMSNVQITRFDEMSSDEYSSFCDNRSKSCLNRSEEERINLAFQHSVAMNARTPEEKEYSRVLREESWSNKSEEELQEWRQAIADNYANKTEEDLLIFSKQVSLGMERRTQEEKLQSVDNWRNSMNSRTEEEKEQEQIKRRAKRASKTEEERNARSKACSSHFKRIRQNKTEEELKAWDAKNSSAQFRWRRIRRFNKAIEIALLNGMYW